MKKKSESFFRSSKTPILAAFFMAAIFLISGCTGKGDMRFNDLPSTNQHSLSGKINIPEIIETALLTSLRSELKAPTDFSTFKVSTGGISDQVSSDGSFSLSKVPSAEDMVLTAESGKIKLLLRLEPDELNYSDTSQLTINIDSTAKAIIWQYGKENNKNLTKVDIAARDFEAHLASVTTAIKLALQLPDSSVSTNILDLPMIETPARNAAGNIPEREQILKDANDVLKHCLIRKDLDILKAYISPSFSNDWDSTSNWNDLIATFEKAFQDFSFETVSWKIQQMELLPENKARIRTEVELTTKNLMSEQINNSEKYIYDAIWRKEGSFWKVFKNMPYKTTHPSQVGADARWGEIAEIHRNLQAALATENINTFNTYISPNFSNVWDPTSTKTDLINTAQARFNAMDVKIATYSIEQIDFTGTDSASVKCSAQIKVINLIPGVDVDSGKVEAIIDWRRENGIWKIYRNLPYRFTHPKTI